MLKSFSFKGINRSTDAVLAQDGECQDIVNLRMSNGSLLPMPPPRELAGLSTRYSAIFRHEIAGCYICITDDADRTLHFYDKDFNPIMSDGEMLVIDNLHDVNGVECLGNFVCCLTARGIFYLMYEKGTYNALGERPSMPVVNVTVSSKVETLKTDESYHTMASTSDLEATWNYNEKGYIEECVSILNGEGYYVDRALFRMALRLYDGSYINISEVIYVSDEAASDYMARDAANMYSEPVDSNVPSQYRVMVQGFKPEFSFDMSSLSCWRNIVVGVDVFSTASIPGKKCMLVGRTEKFEMYTAKTLDELWDEVASASLYYKVAEYDIDGNLLYRLDDVSPVSLALQQGLETAAAPSSFSRLAVQSSYVYNGRLHIAALREYFFGGYDASAYLPVTSGRSDMVDMAVQVKMRTTQGDFSVGRTFRSIPLGYDGYTLLLPALLTYPDARAYEMGIYISAADTVYGKVFQLKPHKYLNMAYYLHKWYTSYSVSVSAVFANGGKPAAGVPADDVLRMFNNELGTHEVIYNASRNCWLYDGSVFPPSEFSSLRIFAIHRDAVNGDKLVFTIKRGGTLNMEFKDINSIPVDDTWDKLEQMPVVGDSPYEERLNVMKVSMVENPFVFPAKCTYAPSQCAIIGICGNTVALSQGQFGQFPLYVFCTDGIWAMSVDSSGNVAYLGCNQVSRDVCVNPDTICGVSGGVVFAGKQGIMLIAGNDIRNISIAIQGNGTPVAGVPDDILAGIASLVSLDCSTGNDNFKSFVSNAFVTSLPAHNEVLVTNAEYGYSFVYSFAWGTWTRFQGRFNGKVKGATDPCLFVVSERETAVMTIPDEISDSNRILLYTRPQLWGSKLPKRVLQLLLHSYVLPPPELSAGMPLLACYMLGSNDGVHFKLIAGNEKNSRAQDVLFPYFPTRSYKYYMFALVGNMGKDSLVTGMDVDITLPWKNRLR